MKKPFLFCLLAYTLMLAACGQKSGLQTGTHVQSGNSSSLPSELTGNAHEYSVEAQDLLGDWELCYYSYDNDVYRDYRKDMSDEGFYSFGSDNIAVLHSGESEESVYRYVLPEDQKGNIVFYDSVTGEAAPFFFGFGVVDTENGKFLIVSKYNSSEQSVLYYILRKIV